MMSMFSSYRARPNRVTPRSLNSGFAAVTRAAPNYLPLAQQANTQVLLVGFGPYRSAKP